MSMFTGIATGFLSAAIKDKEAKDNLRMKIAESAGIDYYTKDKPEHDKKQKLFEKDFKMVELKYGTKVANLFGDQGGFYGDGNGLKHVDSILAKKNISKEDLKNFKFSTFEERQTGRESEFQSRGDQIKNLTGIGGIGPKAAELQLEGFGKTETTDVAPIETTDVAQATDTEQKVSTDISSLFTDKPEKRGVEAKYAHVERAIEAQNGYAQTHEVGADGQVTFTWGPKRKIAAAHIQFATMLLDKDPSLDQNTAASAAKRYLIFYTEKPFADLSSIDELKGTSYTQGNETDRAIYKGEGFVAGKIDINSTQYKGMSIREYILDKIDNLPKTKDGNINEAIFQKFVENVPENLMEGDITFRASLLAQRQTQTLVSNYFALK